MNLVKIALAISLLLASVAYAQEPNEATKIRALKRAYELNGNSMVGWRSIDVSNDPAVVNGGDVTCADGCVPLADPRMKNEIDKLADTPDWDARRKFMNRTFRATKRQLAAAEPADVCARHHMHRMPTNGGRSWKCVR